MTLNPKKIFSLIKEAGADFMADNAPRLGAALSYYTIFSLSPLLLIVIGIASMWFDASDVRSSIFKQVEGMIGKEGSEALASMLVNPEKKETSMIATIIATITLVFGATGAFAQLQAALNQIWEVKQKAGQGIKGFIKTRILSFTMILVIGFLLLVSLVLSAAVAGMSKFMGHYLPGSDAVWQILTFAVSFGVITLLFAAMFKLLPDVRIPWREVWFGALVTALLFSIGKFALGHYLGRAGTTSSFGVAGSLVLILLWVYYSSQILFFGAEITQVHAARNGAVIEPKPHAEWLSECEKPAGTKPKEEPVSPAVKPSRPKWSPRPAIAGAGSAPSGVSGAYSSVMEPSLKFKPVPALLLLALAFVPLGKKGTKLVQRKAEQDLGVSK